MPPALASGFMISSLIVLVAIASLAQQETEKWPMTGRSKTQQAVVSVASGVVLVLAVCAPYLLAGNYEQVWDVVAPMRHACDLLARTLVEWLGLGRVEPPAVL